MKQFLIITLATILTVSGLQAQVQVNNELKSLINKSFAYYPKIKEVENTVITAKQKLDVASINSPTVDGNLSYRFVEPKIQIPINGENFQFAPVHNLDANVTGSYALYDFGRLKANIEKAKTDIQFAEHNVEAAKYQLATQVSTIYYNIIYLQHAISIQDSVLGFLAENKTVIDTKYQNGDALKFDQLNIKSQIDAEQNRKVDLQNSLQKQQNLLAYTTGSKQSNGNIFDFEVALKDIDAALAETQATNLDYVLAKDKIKQALSDVAINKLGDKPTVSVGAGAGFKNGYVPNVGEIRFNYNAGVALRVPIYEGGKTKKQIKLSETLVKQNELAIETLNNNYKKDIEQTLTDVQSNLERIKNT
ncbi:MAG: TolC family protein, partial [Pedobacter sp.]|nr:TolC family protein [Chitinophagaceae bacterium]